MICGNSIIIFFHKPHHIQGETFYFSYRGDKTKISEMLTNLLTAGQLEMQS